MFYINNKLRDEVYESNVRHFFWEYRRTYSEFVINLLDEFEEVFEELMHHDPKEVYFKKENKPEGAPTELADIIIFILDHFGGSEPRVDIDEAFLQEPDSHYKNDEYYEKIRNDTEYKPWQYFIKVSDECKKYISLSNAYYCIHGNNSFTADNGETISVPQLLHKVIKLILLFCDIYGINMQQELRRKIEYNKSRKPNYRHIGGSGDYETDFDKVYMELLHKGWPEQTDYVIEVRNQANKCAAKKREERKNLELES